MDIFFFLARFPIFAGQLILISMRPVLGSDCYCLN
jgi:hypothetical protein